MQRKDYSGIFPRLFKITGGSCRSISVTTTMVALRGTEGFEMEPEDFCEGNDGGFDWDGDALAISGWGTDEDYGFYGGDDYGGDCGE